MTDYTYVLECYRCGKLGTNETFGLGWNRQCPDCRSYEIHASETPEDYKEGR